MTVASPPIPSSNRPPVPADDRLRERLRHVAAVSCSDAHVQARRALADGVVSLAVVEHVERLLVAERQRWREAQPVDVTWDVSLEDR